MARGRGRGRGRGGRRGVRRVVADSASPEPSKPAGSSVPDEAPPAEVPHDGEAVEDDPALRAAIKQSLQHGVLEGKRRGQLGEDDLQRAIKASLSSGLNKKEETSTGSSEDEETSHSDFEDTVVDLLDMPRASTSSAAVKKRKRRVCPSRKAARKGRLQVTGGSDDEHDGLKLQNANIRMRQQYTIAEQHFNRVMKRRVNADAVPKVKSIDVLMSNNFEAAFQRQREAFKMAGAPTKELFAFHASDVEDLQHVLNNNLQVKFATGTKFGRGVYFSEYPVCHFGYAGAGLLLCRILTGREFVDATYKLIPETYHSKRVLSQGGSEELLVVENSSQIVPCYVIHLEKPDREIDVSPLEYKYVTPAAADSSLEEGEVQVSSVSSSSMAGAGIVNLDHSVMDVAATDESDDESEDDDDDDCCSSSKVQKQRKPTCDFNPAAAVLNNDEVANKMRNMFESSLGLHETGEYMQAAESVSTSMYPHQMYALAWMANRENSSKVGVAGGILADDMGLGKTLTVLSLIMTNFHDRRPLAKLQLGYSRSKNLNASVARYMPSMMKGSRPFACKSRLGGKKASSVSKLMEFRRHDLFGLGLQKRRKDTKQQVKSSRIRYGSASPEKQKSKINFSDDEDDEEDEFDSMCEVSFSEKLLNGDEDIFSKSEKHHYDGLSDDEEYQSMGDKERNEKMKPNFKDEDDLGINLDGMPPELESSDNEGDVCEPVKKRKPSPTPTSLVSKKLKTDEGDNDDDDDDDLELPDLDDEELEGNGEPEKPKTTTMGDLGRRKMVPQLTEEQQKNLKIPPRVPASQDGRRRATLVVTPASLLSHWLHQIEEHVDDTVEVRIFVHHGNYKAVTGLELEDYDIVLTTYGTLMAEYNGEDGVDGPLLRAKWLRAVLDEGHFIKNHRSKTHRAAYELDVRRKWVISGTPIQNNLTELWALLHWLEFEPYASHRTLFRNQIEQAVKRGHPNGVKRLQTVMQAICLRRSKTDTINGRPLVNLPRKEVRLVELDFSPEERTVYDAYRSQARELISRYMRKGTLMKNYAHVFAVMMRLRQLCCHRDLLPVKWNDVDMNELLDFVRKQVTANEEGDVKQPDEDRAKELAEQLRAMIKDGMTDECSICLSDFNRPVITPCAHVYCRGCITQHIDAAEHPPAQCPLCRGDLCIKGLLEAAQSEEDDDDGMSNSKWNPFEDIVVDVSSTKVNAALRELEISKEKGGSDKTIIVSQFTSLLSVLQPLLDDAGHSWTRLDGSMSIRQRSEVVAEFQDQSPDSPRVLLLSLRAGGVGLNLTAANRMILLDPAWNPATENQCFDRIHRLGQTRDVEVVKFIHKDSIEEHMIGIQLKKMDLITGAFRQSAAERRQQRIQDIRDIFDL